MEELKQILDFSYKFDLAKVEEDIINRTKLILLDSLGVMVYGNQTKEVMDLAQLSRTSEGVHILGTRHIAAPQTAALINAQGMVSQELDEGNSFAKGHPASHIIPSLLAVASQGRSRGKDFLTSLLIGYEVATRLGYSIGLKNQIHPHGNFCAPGGVIAISKLLGYSRQQMEKAMLLSISLPLVSLWENPLEGHRARDVYVGVINQINTMIPDLIKAGYTGSLQAFKIIYDNILGNLESEKLTKDLGEKYFLMKNYFKQYPYCRYCHNPIEAVQEILQKEDIKIEHIQKVNIYTYKLAAQLNNQKVKNDFAVKFSIPAAVSDVICHQDKKISKSEMAKKVFVHNDQNIERLLPNERNSRVEIILNNGTTYTNYHIGAKGDHHNPFNEEDIKLKFIRLTEPIIGKSACLKVIDTCLLIEKNDISRLISYCIR